VKPITTCACQFVRESDGTLWRQELCWDADDGFTGRFNPERVGAIPPGAIRLDLDGLAWDPCTAGEHVVAAWIAGVPGGGLTDAGRSVRPRIDLREETTVLKLLDVMPDVRAVHGVGDVAKHTLSVLAMCAAEDRLLRGEPIGEATEQVECVSPVLRVVAIARNVAAWESDAARTDWALALVPRLLDTRDDARDVRRAAAVARYAVRVIAAAALRAGGLPEAADRLAALPEDVPLDVAAEAARDADAAASALSAGAAWEAAAQEAASATAGRMRAAARAAREAGEAWEEAAREAARERWAAKAARAARSAAKAANGSASLDELLRIALETE